LFGNACAKAALAIRQSAGAAIMARSVVLNFMSVSCFA
jgi:hypothetical protein